MTRDEPSPDLGLVYFQMTDAEFAAMEAKAEAEDRRSGRPFLYNETTIVQTSRPQKRKSSTHEAKRLAKITRAEQALGVAIRAAERQAAKEDLPTAWFHDSLAYLVKLAKEAV